MLPRLNLDRTRDFEVALAIEKAIEMLCSYIDGQETFASMGVEQGVDKWDDIVLEVSVSELIHYQIKRQNTDFSTHDPERQVRTKGKGKGSMPDLSELDESIKSLGDWYKALAGNPPSPVRRFVLDLPDGEIQIKKGISVNHLAVLCNNHIKPLTTGVGFDALITQDSTVANIITWLKSWCGFTDNAECLSCLRLLDVKRTGSTDQITDRAKANLGRLFNSADVVYAIINAFVTDNTSFTVTISPKALLGEVAGYLKPEIRNWTQYSKTGTVYEKRGTQDTQQGRIEHPSVFVPALLNPSKFGILRFDEDVNLRQNLPRAIVRLALHLQNGGSAQLVHKDGWKQAVKQAVGETFGSGLNDCDSLNFADCQGSRASFEYEPLRNSTEHEAEATLINQYIQEETWRLICGHLDQRVLGMNISELKTAVEARWEGWKQRLISSPNEQFELCRTMLHPAAEGDEIHSDLRVGPKTASLISNGIFLLLVVSVALDGTDDSWDTVASGLSMHAKANRYWSGPNGSRRYPRKLLEKGREDLISSEPTKILILPEIDASPSQVRNLTLADEKKPENTLATIREPKALITWSPELTDLIDDGIIIPIKNYLELQLN